MGFGSFAGGLATGWATASKMIGDDEDRAERKKSAELERESRRMLNEDRKREQERKKQIDDVATTLSKGGKEQTTHTVDGVGSSQSSDTANWMADTARADDELRGEYAVENPGTSVAPLYTPGGLDPKKTTSMYSRSKALDDAGAQAAGNAELLDALEAKRKLYKNEGMAEAIAELRRTGDIAAAGKVFDQYGDVRLPKEVLAGRYDPKTDSVTMPNGGVIPLKRFELDTLGVKDREDLRIKELTAQGRIDGSSDALATKILLAGGLGQRGAGSGTGTSAGGKGVSENGIKYATHEDFTKLHLGESGKVDPEKANMAYLTYQQLLGSNPNLKSMAPGEAAARVLASQYAEGKIQAAPEIGDDGRWGYYLAGNGGNKYLLDKPEWGIDPTSLNGPDGKPRSRESVDKAEREFLQNIEKRSPAHIQEVREVALDNKGWSNVLAAYDDAKAGKIQMSPADLNGLRSQIALGNLLRKHPTQEKPAAKAGEQAKAPAFSQQDLDAAAKYGVKPSDPGGQVAAIGKTYADGWSGLKAAASDVVGAVRGGSFSNALAGLRGQMRAGPGKVQPGTAIAIADLINGNPELKSQLSADELSVVRAASGKPNL